MKPHKELPQVGRIIRIPSDTPRGYALAKVYACGEVWCMCDGEHVVASLLPSERIADRSANSYASFNIRPNVDPWEYAP